MTKIHPKSHVLEPIDTTKSLSGFGRKGAEVPPEVQQKVIDIIVAEGRKNGMNNREIAYYLAIAKRESEFNPDAATPGGSASGVAQVTNETGKIYGIDNTNRFDARKSVAAGMAYFRHLRDATIRDYGSATGKFEPLIYYRYHYGEFMTMHAGTETIYKNGKGYPREKFTPRDFASELDNNARYRDSKTVVTEAARIEALLSGPHGLVVRLTDVTGKAVSERTLIVMQKRLKATPQASPVAPPKAALQAAAPATSGSGHPTGPVAVPTAASVDTTSDAESGIAAAPATNAPLAGNAPVPLSSEELAPAANSTFSAIPSTEQVAPGSADVGKTGTDGAIADKANVAQTAGAIPADSAPVPEEDFEYEIVAYEVQTDENGEIPEILTADQQPVMILIPRIDYKEYNEAVDALVFSDAAVEHDLRTSDGESVRPAVGAHVPVPTAPSKVAQPRSPAPSVFAAAAAPVKKIPPSTLDSYISFAEMQATMIKKFGWNDVHAGAFSYVKQVQTRPKMPAAPLTSKITAKAGPARVQVIGSSLTNKDMKAPKVQEKVNTAEITAVKPLVTTGEASWMNFAIKEQEKKGDDEVTDNKRNPAKDSEWKKLNAIRENSTKRGKTARGQLSEELRKKKQDPVQIAALQAEIVACKKAYAEADAAMRVIEKTMSNPDIIKYLESTDSGGDIVRTDESAWCASFVNWCLAQAGYSGVRSAAGARFWVNYGVELSEPKYGAITIVTRGRPDKKGIYPHHIGFFLGITQKRVSDGYDEVESIDKKTGEKKVKKVPKFKMVDMVKLLSGNMSSRIREFAQWSVKKEDNDSFHLVTYRWPSSNEKKK